MGIRLKGARTMIECTCPNCGRILKIRDEYAGRWGRCNYCHARVLAPARPISQVVQKVFKDAENSGMRLTDVTDANTHWMLVRTSGRVEPGLVYVFHRLIDAREALLGVSCIHVAEDSGALISTEAITFGCYELNDGNYEAVVCGEELRPELYEEAVRSFTRHRGKPKYQRAPTVHRPVQT